ncbi:MAG: hypothetical protein JWR08_207, partial [Enterovirga sp.]|nr:hypothetical protein [Enterovirga sp.]
KIAFLAPRADLTPEDFRRHWREVHGPVVSHAPGYAAWRRRYLQNHVLGPGPFGEPLAQAGMAEFWLPSANEDAYALSPTYLDHVRPDEANFIDFDRTVSMTAVEVEISLARPPLKLVILCRCAAALAPEEHAAASESRARAMRGRLADAGLGYALNLVLPGSLRLPGARATDGPAIDALHALWFRDRAALDGLLADRDARTALGFEDSSLNDPGGLVSFLAEEVVFFENGRPV